MKSTTVTPPKPAPVNPLGPALGAIAGLSQRVRDRAAGIVADAKRRCEPFLRDMEAPAAKAAALEAEHRPWLTQLVETLESNTDLQNYQGAFHRARTIQYHAQSAIGLMESAKAAIQEARQKIAEITPETRWLSYLEVYWRDFLPIVTAAPGGIEREITNVREGLQWFATHAAALPLGHVVKAAPLAEPEPARYAISAISGQREG